MNRLVPFLWSLLLLSGLVLAADGNQGGSSTTIWGGGEIIFVGDRPELRDFGHYCDWKPGSALLQSNPALSQILNKIEAFHWIHADRMRYTLANLTFCFTETALPAIAPADPLDGAKSNIQTVGLRTPSIVFLNKPLFGQLKDSEQAWLVVHEILHAYIPQQVEWRSLKLRSFVHGLQALLEAPQPDLEALASLINYNDVLWPLSKLGSLVWINQIDRTAWNQVFYTQFPITWDRFAALGHVRRIVPEDSPWLLDVEKKILTDARLAEAKYLVSLTMVGDVEQVKEVLDKGDPSATLVRWNPAEATAALLPPSVAAWLSTQTWLLMPELAVVKNDPAMLQFYLSREKWRNALRTRHLNSEEGERGGSRALCLAYVLKSKASWDLLMALPNIHINDPCLDSNLLITVAASGGLDQLKDLLKRSDLDLYATDRHCHTALQVARLNHQREAARLLHQAERTHPRPAQTPTKCEPHS